MMTPGDVNAARRILTEGGGVFVGGKNQVFKTYESDVNIITRFMVESNLVGGGWVTFPGGKYTERLVDLGSGCQAEVDIMYDDLEVHRCEGNFLDISPLRTLSFDIECSGRPGIFPDPEHDSVIQIANVLQMHGSEMVLKNVFTLGTCDAILNTDVFSFSSEEEMLCAWSHFVYVSDPDVMTGYNIVNFDFHYLLERAKHLCLQDFFRFTRMDDEVARFREMNIGSAQLGNRETYEITVTGRVIFDVFQCVQRDYKLHSYTLNAVSGKFLGEQKEDVHYSSITELQNGTSETRRRLAVYCVKDALLPLRLIEKLMFFVNYTEMARVTGVPIGWLLVRGQSVKVMSQILRKCRERGLLVPTFERSESASSGESFTGATVIEPKRGFYSQPIATLDFASLYPSIMIAHNTSYDTLITDKVFYFWFVFFGWFFFA